MKRLLAIIGPTATGKTDIGLDLAKKFNGELISCDSRQVYKGLDLGTGKLPGKEVSLEKNEEHWILDGIKVWMYDVISPNCQFTVKDYLDQTLEVLKIIEFQNKLPIMVGGTGLYLKALLDGLDNVFLPIDSQLRSILNTLSLEELQDKLQEISVTEWNNLNNSDRHNKRRLIRKIELFNQKPNINQSNTSMGLKNHYDILIVGLFAPREVLNKRIDQRVVSRLNQGMIEESERLLKEGISLKRMDELGLEYRYLGKYLEGELNKEEMIKTLMIKIHQYAKRQMTWYKKEKNIHWFNIMEKNYTSNIEKLVLDWYNGTN